MKSQRLISTPTYWKINLMADYVFWEENIVAFRAEGFNFDEFKSWGLHEKHPIPTWDWQTFSAFAWMREGGGEENLCQDGRSQDLPYGYWHLASSLANKRMWQFPNVFAVALRERERAVWSVSCNCHYSCHEAPVLGPTKIASPVFCLCFCHSEDVNNVT
jgi:hypothetical protein